MNRLNNLKISTKVAGAFAFVFAITIILGTFSVMRLAAVNEGAADVRDNWLPATRALGELAAHTTRYRQLEAAYILANTPEQKGREQETLRTVIQSVAKTLAAYEPTVTSAEEKVMADAMKSGWVNYLDSHKKLVALVTERGDEAAATFYATEMRPGFSKVRDAVQAALEYNVREATKATNAGEQMYLSARLWIIAAIAFAGLLSGVAGFVIIRSVSRPISALTGTMSQLAAHDLSATVNGQERGDEVGAMAKAVQVFKDSMIEGDRLAAEQKTEQARKEKRQVAVDGFIQTFEKSVGSVLQMVSSASTELQSTAQSMTATAEETQRQSTAVAAASEQASTNVQTVASAAEELSSSITEISRQVTESTRIAGQAVADAERTNAEIQGLSEAAQKIGDVVKLINDIAGQTNLLALNATIEAARAGEAGKGFAVVASEVKNLASQTAKATEEISSKIAEMQASTGRSVTAVQGIGQTIGRINEIATTIASAVEEQGAATQEIARNVQQASAGTAEVSSNIVGVTKAATDTGAASAQVLGASGELSKQSETLRTEVTEFLGNIRAA